MTVSVVVLSKTPVGAESFRSVGLPEARGASADTDYDATLTK
jgi:hypothetical protein